MNPTPTHITLGGFVALAALTVALFLWLHTDMNAGLAGVENRLGAQIDGVEARLNARIDGVETRLNKRIDEVEARLGARIDEVEDRLGRRIDEVDARIERLEEGQNGIREHMARLDGEIEAVFALAGPTAAQAPEADAAP